MSPADLETPLWWMAGLEFLIPTSWTNSSVLEAGVLLQGGREEAGKAHGNRRRSLASPPGLCSQWVLVLHENVKPVQSAPAASQGFGNQRTIANSFPGVSLLKKKNLFVVLNLCWGAGMGWLGNPWSSKCNWYWLSSGCDCDLMMNYVTKFRYKVFRHASILEMK